MLHDNEILLVDIYDPSVNELIEQLNKCMPSYMGAKVFTSDEVLAICQDLQSRYKLDGPLEVFSTMVKSKRWFIMAYCDRNQVEKT